MKRKPNRSERLMIASWIVLAALAGAAYGAVSGASTGDASPSGPPRAAQQAGPPAAEHHMHIRSAAAADLLNELDRVSDSPRASPAAREPMDAADAIAALDAADVERAVVLSLGYMFGMPDLEVEDEAAKVRAENLYVAEQVAEHPDRLVGACSVNPLADYAFDEIERCGEDPRVSGLKLHLTNSDVDLWDPAHVERLRNIFQKLGRLGLPVVVHMRTRHREYGAEDARIFIREVLSEAPGLPVQIAHMAGWGGYDDATDEALGAFIEAIEAGELDRSRVTFDLGAVVFQPSAAGADTTLARSAREANERLAGRIRELGTDRVVFATDWPSWPPVPDPREGVERNIRLVRGELALTPTELADVFANEGPILSGRR